MSRPAGVTLLELLVVLVLLGLLLGMSGVAVTSLAAPRASAPVRQMEMARAAAIRSGLPVAVTVDSAVVRFLPDGRALGPGVDPLTGAPGASR
jgi:prepilin-type N-terminal cleavage/methylation domain-containing protein